MKKKLTSTRKALCDVALTLSIAFPGLCLPEVSDKITLARDELHVELRQVNRFFEKLYTLTMLSMLSIT